MKHIDKKYCFKKNQNVMQKQLSTIMSELYQKVACSHHVGVTTKAIKQVCLHLDSNPGC